MGLYSLLHGNDSENLEQNAVSNALGWDEFNTWKFGIASSEWEKQNFTMAYGKKWGVGTVAISMRYSELMGWTYAEGVELAEAATGVVGVVNDAQYEHIEHVEDVYKYFEPAVNVAEAVKDAAATSGATVSMATKILNSIGPIIPFMIAAYFLFPLVRGK